MLEDVVKACDPWNATVFGDFMPRGGVKTKITAEHSRPRGKRRP
jgi:NADPH-dependent 7-cyano-7-deazaguanine reductase QueF